jgi:hypothetical protein
MPPLCGHTLPTLIGSSKAPSSDSTDSSTASAAPFTAASLLPSLEDLLLGPPNETEYVLNHLT